MAIGEYPFYVVKNPGAITASTRYPTKSKGGVLGLAVNPFHRQNSVHYEVA